MRRAIVFALLLALTAMFSVRASGSTESDLKDVRNQIDSLDAQIKAAKSDQTEAAVAVAAAKKKLDDLAGQVLEAQGILDSIKADIGREQDELDKVTAQLERFESALAATRLKVADTKDKLSAQVVELYINASTAGLRLFGFKDATEAAIGYAYMDGAMGDSASLLDQLGILEDEEDRQTEILDQQKEKQRTLLADLNDKRKTQEDEVGRLDGLKDEAVQAAAQAQALVNKINGQIQDFEEHKEGLEADAAALEKELAARPVTGEIPAGKLMRPVPGRVTSGFGYRVHPIFGTKKLHTGWDMQASYGDPIHAAADGVVVSAGPRGGYGNAVVIDHGGGMATLYAHQSRVAVSAGQHVSQGQVVGYVGCTGYCTGPHLHFEVRIGGRPVDPTPYMG